MCSPPQAIAFAVAFGSANEVARMRNPELETLRERVMAALGAQAAGHPIDLSGNVSLDEAQQQMRGWLSALGRLSQKARDR